MSLACGAGSASRRRPARCSTTAATTGRSTRPAGPPSSGPRSWCARHFRCLVTAHQVRCECTKCGITASLLPRLASCSRHEASRVLVHMLLNVRASPQACRVSPSVMTSRHEPATAALPAHSVTQPHQTALNPVTADMPSGLIADIKRRPRRSSGTASWATAGP